MRSDNGWPYLTFLAKEYLSYLPVGNDPLNRNERQREIVNYVLPAIRPYLFRLANQMKNGSVRIRNVTGRYSSLSLRGCQISSEDLVQIAFLDLHRNFHKYRPEYQFATFVHTYVCKAMYRSGIRESLLVVLPYGNVSRFRVELTHASSPDEAISRLREFLVKKNPKIRDPTSVARVIFMSLYSSSLDIFGRGSSLEESYDESLEARIDSGVETPLDVVERADIRECLFSADTLDERDIIILWGYYFGEETLDAIGERFGLSRERVRQVKERALGKERDYLCR